MSPLLKPQSRISAPASSEIVELPRFCSMFDRPYVARYARDARGRYWLTETAKLDARAGKRGPTAKRTAFSMSHIAVESERERCPWCGANGNLTHCENCRCFVCSGQLRIRNGKDFFRCRASCGVSGYIDGVVDNTEGWSAPSLKRLALPAQGQSPALPGGTPRTALTGVSSGYV
jgi:hypothetical protein